MVKMVNLMLHFLPHKKKEMCKMKKQNIATLQWAAKETNQKRKMEI